MQKSLFGEEPSRSWADKEVVTSTIKFICTSARIFNLPIVAVYNNNKF